jgi:multidrug efflux system outer membrane protein
MTAPPRRPAPANLTFVAIAFTLATGCTVGPDYQTPETRLSDQWASRDVTGASTQPTLRGEAAEVAQWWRVFDDPVLDSLIARAAADNLDLAQATARVRAARASRGVASAAIFPNADVSGSYRRSDSGPGDDGDNTTTVPVDTDGDGIPDSTSTRSFGDEGPRSLYQAGFDASWEIDVFGGIRRDVEAAGAEFRAAVEDRRDVLVTLLSEVAINYVDLRSFQRRLAIARRNIELQRQSAAITMRRVEAEFENGLDRANAISLVASSQAEIPSLEASERQTVYALSVLLGREPGELLAELSLPGDIPAAPSDVPIGLPSDLLRRRPDIRRADARLHAATARVGVARADLFPRFSLTGSLGVSGERPGSLTSGDNWQWSFGPAVSWPLFDAGRIRSNIAVQSASQEEALLAYRSTVLVALQDVETSLVALTKEQQRRLFLAEAAAANRDAVRLSNLLYENGLAEFLDVINAQRSLFSSEDALVQSDRTIATNLISLYKALGGGWEQPAVQ